uniref:glycoside hydrolase domain-containing protein n=1 Tax=uncultured Draconibacterium sp. TaxID=1573823 RepID=UPI003217A951
MKLLNLLILFFFSSVALVTAQEKTLLNPDLYGTGNWDADSLGNHRVVIKVNEQADVVWAHIPWRRRDLNPQEKGIIIVDASTGKQIKNIYPASVNREYGDILFQAQSVPGKYYIYYLKHKMHGRSNYPKVSYPGFVSKAEKNWLAKAKAASSNFSQLPKSELLEFQAIDPFNSFYPMEIIATREETSQIIQEHPGSEYLLFPEVRENSIRMTTDLPLKWIQDGVKSEFTAKVQKGEYFTFQIGCFAAQKDLSNIEVKFSGLSQNGNTVLDANAFTCFNTEGIDWEGKPFKKTYKVAKGHVQPLWMGVELPVEITAGEYECTVFVKPESMPETQVRVKLQVSEFAIANSGDNNPERLSRLRWLNSTIAEDDEIVAPYPALEINGNKVKCLGREVTFGKNGFPESIQSYFSESVTRIQNEGKEILAAPIDLFVQTTEGKQEWTAPSFKMIKQKEGAIAWDIKNEMPGLQMTGKVQMEFDGNINYKLILTATKDLEINDIGLEIPLQPNAAKYMMGLGEKGGFRSKEINWKWAVEKNQDGPWIGDVNAGIQARFTDNNYVRPLNTNFYQDKPLYMPDSWYNDGKGGINITSSGKNTVTLNSYSGSRTIKKGEQLHYYFNLLITPFRPVDTKKHWHNRYYHSSVPVDTALAHGANTINLHHANKINSFINYPFFIPAKMKAYIDEAHSKDTKVKIYYTVRELTNKAPELFMLRSLGEEIFSYGKGGGFSWLQEHLDPNYMAAWFVPSIKDAAVVNTGISRWHNFYIEGLNWLVKNVGIDGVYIDDLAFDRTSMKRIRKVLERGNPGALIDLHSANQYNPRDGFANSANLYLEHLPYIDRLWFGEYFDYNLPPDFWLIETSGLPFGLMGEMLQDGGNPWRGMIFGMTGRAPRVNVSPLWKAWDNFGMKQSEMIGYWDSNNPVKTGSKDTYATAYVKKGKQTLIAIATWAQNDDEVKLDINWETIGLKQSKAEFYAPAIEGYQDENKWAPNEKITVPKGKGFLIIVREKK